MFVNSFRHVWFQRWMLGHGANFAFLQPYADVDHAQNFLYLLAAVVSKTFVF